MFRCFVGSMYILNYFDYPGRSLVGGSILSKYRMYHSNDTELMLVVL